MTLELGKYFMYVKNHTIKQSLNTGFGVGETETNNIEHYNKGCKSQREIIIFEKIIKMF